MNDASSKAPAKYIAMHAAGASAEDVFKTAMSEGFRRIDCALIVAGLYALSFQEARRIGFAVEQRSNNSET